MLTSVSRYSAFSISGSPINAWDSPGYDGWGNFAVEVEGTQLSDKEYFGKYISLLLRGYDQKPPGLDGYAKGIYDSFIEKAISGGPDLPPHAKAYLSRSDEIRKNGGYKGTMSSEFGEAEIEFIRNKLGLDRVDTSDGSSTFSIKTPDADSDVIIMEDLVIIDGISLGINKSTSMNFVSGWYA